ncbi:hypothetical protein LINPERPRIM_LOCUS23438, partial [Linum perenne]
IQISNHYQAAGAPTEFPPQFPSSPAFRLLFHPFFRELLRTAVRFGVPWPLFLTSPSLFLLPLFPPFLAVLVFPSVRWPLGSYGCGTMTVTDLPLSDLQALLRPDDTFRVMLLGCCFSVWFFSVLVFTRFLKNPTSDALEGEHLGAVPLIQQLWGRILVRDGDLWNVAAAVRNGGFRGDCVFPVDGGSWRPPSLLFGWWLNSSFLSGWCLSLLSQLCP